MTTLPNCSQLQTVTVSADSPTKGVRYPPPLGHANIMLVISYQGHAFSGYQVQPHAKSVQQVVNAAWKIYTGEDVTLYACSRLDAGVHANHFVLNFYSASEKALEVHRLVRGLNGIFRACLKEPICVLDAALAPPLFNARFDAVGKHYRYLIWYGRGEHARLTPQCWLLKSSKQPANLEAILQEFEGTHDFSAFRASDCMAKSTVRTIRRIDVWSHPRFADLTIVDVWGEGFLKNMIRNIVGTGVDLAIGRLPRSTIAEGFQHGQRTRTGQCAPGHALTLQRVYYDPAIFEQDTSDGARNLAPV